MLAVNKFAQQLALRKGLHIAAATSAAAGQAKTGKIASDYPVIDHTFDAVVVGAGETD